MNNTTQPLQQSFIKQEIFDHLIYPLNVKLDDNLIIQLFRKLHFMSSIDYKISIDDWLKQSITFINGLSEKEAIVLFNTYKVISLDLESSNLFNKKPDCKSSNTVDVRYFGLFFALQLYLQKNRLTHNVDLTDINSYNVSINQITILSPISSPRNKQNALKQSSANLSEVGNMVAFVRNNIKLLLRLIATDIHNSETQLNSNEFNTLEFFFRFKQNKRGLASLAPFFMNFSPTTKVSIEKISEWLSSFINTNQSDNDEFTVVIKNLSKCLTVKEDLSGKSVKLINCEDSQIFIDSVVYNLKISNCSNCIIYCSAVQKFTTIENTKGSSVCVATNFLKIGSCLDCKINAFCSQEPVLYGDNKNNLLGPHNVSYEGLMKQISLSKIYSSNQILDLVLTPIILNNITGNNTNTSISTKSFYEILNPKDFTQMITPFNKDNNQSFFLTPKEYIQTIFEYESNLVNLQKSISESQLNEQQEKSFHEAIQGYFKEWLQTSGKLRTICDIVKVIEVTDNEEQM